MERTRARAFMSSRCRAAICCCLFASAVPMGADQSASSTVRMLETFVAASYPEVRARQLFGSIGAGPILMSVRWQFDTVGLDMSTTMSGRCTEVGCSEDVQLSVHWQSH